VLVLLLVLVLDLVLFVVLVLVLVLVLVPIPMLETVFKHKKHGNSPSIACYIGFQIEGNKELKEYGPAVLWHFALTS
jgi:hypothetical protein